MNTSAYHMWNPVMIILKLWDLFVFCLKHFHGKTTTNYHILGLRGCFHGLSVYACVKRACFRPACFLCLHDMFLSYVFLDPDIIVLAATYAWGTPWTFLLTFFNKKVQNGRWKCCNFFVFDNNASAALRIRRASRWPRRWVRAFDPFHWSSINSFFSSL